jgi:hypothetical protein
LHRVPIGIEGFFSDKYSAASKVGMLERDLIEKATDRLSATEPMKAVFDHNGVKKISESECQERENTLELAERLRHGHSGLPRQQRSVASDYYLVCVDRVIP